MHIEKEDKHFFHPAMHYLSREEMKSMLWLKEVAPSKDLRKWFGHDPKKWPAFRSWYFHELESQPEAVNTLIQEAEKGAVTLVFAAKDTEHNNAVALKEYMQKT